MITKKKKYTLYYVMALACGLVASFFIYSCSTDGYYSDEIEKNEVTNTRALSSDIVFELWLKDVPDYSISFCQWMLAYSMIDAIQAPLWMLITASGNIKLYSIWSSSLVILNLPMAWFLLYCGYSPLWIFITRFVINLITAIIRIFYVKAYFSFPSDVFITIEQPKLIRNIRV